VRHDDDVAPVSGLVDRLADQLPVVLGRRRCRTEIGKLLAQALQKRSAALGVGDVSSLEARLLGGAGDDLLVHADVPEARRDSLPDLGTVGSGQVRDADDGGRHEVTQTGVKSCIRA
jgi:hypothetical protein